MKRLSLIVNICISFLLIFHSGCKHDKIETIIPGKVKLVFTQTADGMSLAYDSIHYLNAAGNEFLVNEIQYFISDIDLYSSSGIVTRLKRAESQDVYYIDSHLSSTWTCNVADQIAPGSYDSIAFTFGINGTKNKTGLFINPPEVNMFWPDIMGGGYHLIKMNGSWLDLSNQWQPFNFHIGIGTDTFPSPTIFYDNSFRVHLPGSSFAISENTIKTININMNIDSWFITPHLWDWNVTGGAIMQYQGLMQMAKENGQDVFSVNIN